MAYIIEENCIGCTACVHWCPVNAIHGQRKQLHVIDPALCIECGACGRVCPADCILDGSKQRAQQIKPALWSKPAFDYAKCTDCRICVIACPAGCLVITPPEHSNGQHPGQPYLAAAKKCMACAFCAQECPTLAIQMLVPQPQPA